MRRFTFGVSVLIVAAGILLPESARAIGRFDIKPVTVTFAPGDASASVEFTNSGTAAQELEIAVRSWTRSDGSEEGDTTDDIIASPSIFVVAPGQTQVVRLGSTRDLTGDVEHTYRLVATEVPSTDDRSEVKTILRMRLPVFITPRTVVAPPLTWHGRRTDAARIRITAENTGNVHRRIRALRVTAAGRVLFDNVVAAYVLAHQSRDWEIDFKGETTTATIDVRETEMDGGTREASLTVR